MDRQEFGKLLATLRKEHIDEEGKQWTQEKLAQRAHLPPEIIGNIERGRRSHLSSDILIQLATALNLTNAERRELLLAANPVQEQHIVRTNDHSQTVFADLVNRVAQTPQPAYLIDVYCDIVACNDAVLHLLNLLPEHLQDRTNHPIAAANMMRFVFAPEFADYLAQGEQWHTYAQYNMALFKQLTLQYRTQPYFMSLIAELRQWTLFRRYWFQLSEEVHDPLLETEDIHIHSPHWNNLAYFSTSLTALTSQGNLFLYVYVPADEATAEVFSEITHQTHRHAYRFGSWPDKNETICRVQCVGS